MNATTLENYLSQFSKTKDISLKNNIIEEIKLLVASETPEERKEGIESIGQAVENIAKMLEPKLALQH